MLALPCVSSRPVNQGVRAPHVSASSLLSFHKQPGDQGHLWLPWRPAQVTGWGLFTCTHTVTLGYRSPFFFFIRRPTFANPYGCPVADGEQNPRAAEHKDGSWIYPKTARPGGGKAGETPRRWTGEKHGWRLRTSSVLSASKVGT